MSCASRRHYGNYYNKWRYWGAMFVLKADSTFDYTLRDDLGPVTIADTSSFGIVTQSHNFFVFYDSSYGRYELYGDTLYLTYFTDTVKGYLNGDNARPQRLLWQGKKLFYFSANGYAVKKKEWYMVFRKDKVANLSRWDEKYGKSY